MNRLQSLEFWCPFFCLLTLVTAHQTGNTLSALPPSPSYLFLFFYITPIHRCGSRNFSKGGGLRRKNFEKKCLLIHVSKRVHIKTRQICNSFSLLPYQEDCLLFFVLFYYSLLFLKFERGRGGLQPP